jgi:alkylation response protein AidB-like acyl-CoA dehydrogenase
MSIAITDEHRALADAAARWCEERCPPTVVRATLDAAPAEKPPFWDDLVGLGWLGLALPADVGGQGFGLAELVVVLEQVGRAVVPGPVVPSILAGLVMDRLGSDEQRDAYLPGIADGSTIATVAAFDPDPMTAEPHHEGGLVVDGSSSPVLCAAVADLVVAPVLVEANTGEPVEWVVFDRRQLGRKASSALGVESHTGLDLTRPPATVTAKSVHVADSARLGTDRDWAVPWLTAFVAAAEAVGVAAWCVDTAAEHARQRVQFGRPIGQFQAVKHRCADRLADLELARAAVWDAARGGARDEERLAMAAALCLAPDAAVTAAQDCIQTLGGMGFTWEHDAHLYLRRATATRSLLAPSADWREQLVDLTEEGVTRDLPVALPDPAEAHRAEVQTFLSELSERPKDEWDGAIVDAGYLVPHWPTPWGRDARAIEQLVIDQEFRQAQVRRRHLAVGAWALPTLIAHGSAQQQERWMLPSLHGDVTWCQLFSEPEAGSDLASLRTRAERASDGWSLTGQKVWTSMAAEADWGICLARTDADAPKHQGITCFFVDMTAAGIDIRPLTELTGAAWFNEVFLDDVFVPDDCVIGDVGDGWRAGRTTLANERVSMGSGASIGSGVRAVVDLLGEDAPLHEVDRVGALLATEHALGALRTRMTLRAMDASGSAEPGAGGADGGQPGSEASVVKLLGVLHDQDVQEVGLSLLGPAGVTAEDDADQWVQGYLWNRCLTIAGGTSEIQRNVIAERLLRLPKDP